MLIAAPLRTSCGMSGSSRWYSVRCRASFQRRKARIDSTVIFTRGGCGSIRGPSPLACSGARVDADCSTVGSVGCGGTVGASFEVGESMRRSRSRRLSAKCHFTEIHLGAGVKAVPNAVTLMDFTRGRTFFRRECASPLAFLAVSAEFLSGLLKRTCRRMSIPPRQGVSDLRCLCPCRLDPRICLRLGSIVRILVA